MNITSLLVNLLVIGVLLYVVNAIVPMGARMKDIFNVVVTVLVLFYLLKAFGLDGHVTWFAI